MHTQNPDRNTRTSETLNSANRETTFNFSQGDSQTTAIAKEVLTDLMQFRRSSGPESDCLTASCERCLEPHLLKIVSAIEHGKPILFVLAAFPGKSPNTAKVLGPLPDMAEIRALQFLQHLCDRVKRRYSPGARIVLCSDGRVFSDVVGMGDEDVTAYQKELSKMITDLGLTSISIFNLEELYDQSSFDQMRSLLMERHGEPLETLKASVSRAGKGAGSSPNCTVDDKEAHALYCGITRFLLEDALFPGQKQSRTALQKECRVRAYKVIQRSKAWSTLIEARFPDAVRLSIHPQTCGSKKMGIHLIDPALWPDNWQTPWHGVAVDIGTGRFILLKRRQAEALGAHLVHQEGRPSHYVLTDETALSKLQGLGGYAV